MIIGLDGLSGSAAFGSWRRFLLSEEGERYGCVASKASLGPILERLYAAGISVKIADRQSGAIIESTHLYRVAS